MQKQKSDLLEEDQIYLDTHSFERDSVYEYNSSSPEPEFSVPPLPLVTYNRESDSIQKWHQVDTKGTKTTTPGFDRIRRKVKDKFGIQPYRWQTSVVLDILDGSDVALSAGTSAGKSLPYQAIPVIRPHAIVLVVSPTIALMEDQVRSIKERGLNALALTSDTTSNNPNVWKDIEVGVYSVVLAAPEMLFESHSRFWLSTIRNRINVFCQRLACIAVDEAHLIWGWREFRAEYCRYHYGGVIQSTFIS